MFRPYKNYLCKILTAIVCNFSRIFRLVAMTMIKAALYLSSHNINIILAINVFLQCSPYFILSFFPSRLILYFVTPYLNNNIIQWFELSFSFFDSILIFLHYSEITLAFLLLNTMICFDLIFMGEYF